MPNKISFRGKIKELKGGRGDSLGLQGVMPACCRQGGKASDKYYLVRTELNGKAYLGFRAAGLAVPPRVLEIGKM